MPGINNVAVFALTTLLGVLLPWLPFCSQVPALEINDDISVDTVWTVADSPVLIHKVDFTVPVGVTLAIRPGVTMRVKSFIFVYGVLSAVGTPTDRIHFTKHDGDSNWAGIHFEYTEGVLNENEIQYADLSTTGGVNGSVNSDRQSVAMDNCSIMVDGNHSKAVYGYGGIIKPEGLAMSLTNSTLAFTSTYDGGYNEKVEAVHLDGFDATVSGNTISLSSAAENGWVTALRLTCSNTEAFIANIFDNDITVTGTHDGIMNIYGIYFDDWEASGEVRNNTVLLTGPRSVTGVSTYGADEISGNDITGVITTDYLTAKGYGIYSLAGNAGSNDYIFDNTISLSTNRNNICLYGIHAQSGRIRNNRITATHSGDSGKAYGLSTDYYQIYIENNSILLWAPGVSEYGIAFNTHYNESKTSYLKNNILQGSAGGNSKGIYKSTGYLASVVNSYNTVYNFTDAFRNLIWPICAISASCHFSYRDLCPFPRTRKTFFRTQCVFPV